MSSADLGLSFIGGHLDRGDKLRKDPAWLANRLARPDTLLVPVWRALSPIADGGAVICRREALPRLVETASETTFLGLDGKTAVFAVDLSEHEKERAIELVGDAEFQDLRHAVPILDAREAALLAYARGMLHWHRHHRYCGLCGHPSASRQGGHMRLCTNPECGQEIFPRTDPAVIMLVAHQPVDGEPRCLLAHHGRLPPRAYSTLAGFVEPGESLEEAVTREVFEETGVRVEDVVYQASQPWPFPASIMLGFRARARTHELDVDPDELEDARWFTAEELRHAGEWEDETARIRLSRRDSIARFLIDSWLKACS